MKKQQTVRTIPMKVKNMGFLLDRLGEDCGPLQHLRELTMNSIEAIQKLPQKGGEIVWDFDWHEMDLGDAKVPKLSIIDNGIGMTGEEMVEYINQLSSSGNSQSIHGNFGVRKNFYSHQESRRCPVPLLEKWQRLDDTPMQEFRNG